MFTPLLPEWPATWADALPPTRTAALARVERVRPAAYAKTRNHLQGAVTGLSPYLTHGLLTMPEVLTQLLKRESMPVDHKLVYEFGWREFFRHAWAHSGDGILQSIHPGPLPDEAYAPQLPQDIRQACTGLPVIDQAVRTLYATGTLHNHARMWLASYVVHVRKIDWRAGADWLVTHLLDGDLASNHLSWQWVAGTGSHKPYLFNAENVARYAPEAWHSPGSVVDCSYEALDRMARGPKAPTHASAPDAPPTIEPAVHNTPPAALGVALPDASAVRGREVWLVHPWALREPPADVPADALRIGVYLKEHHAPWPWPEARWRWVDSAMAAVAPLRWHTDAAGLANALAGAARVRSTADPHLSRWLQPIAHLDAAPMLFPAVERHCTSFSQWWTRATRGLKHAEELL
ncbi:MAG: deoxyribodipyrimidine photolyase [Comamonadaceae bacterium]|jgi:deoxyribodipyrimidine photo-lyase|nr:deoxyribodipyrimidine photolyase [Comamonadaceae bacterium]